MKRNKQCSMLALLGMALMLIANHAQGQELPTRYTLLEWINGMDVPVQTCLAETTKMGDSAAIVNGRIYVEDYAYFLEEIQYSSVHLAYTDPTGTFRDPIKIHETYADRSRVEFAPDSGMENLWLEYLEISPDWYILATDLSRSIEADSAWLEFVSTPETATWYDEKAVIDLLIQQIRHWCVDRDGDRQCEPFVGSDGNLYPASAPMRYKEQAELAECLDSHRGTKVVVVKSDFQISGAPNFPELAQWTGECPVLPDMFTAAPEKVVSPTASEACLLFHSWLFRGQYVPPYYCHLEESPGDGQLSGQQIRDQMDESIGTFPGFTCPAPSQDSSTPPTSENLRFDTLTLEGGFLRTIGEKRGQPTRPSSLDEIKNGRLLENRPRAVLP